MFIVLLSIFIVLPIILFVLARTLYTDRYDNVDGSGYACYTVGGIACVIALAMLICLTVGICKVGTAARYEQKITVYEEENTLLEEKLEGIVSEYLEHEGLVYDKITPSVSLIVVYPELASNELVARYVDILDKNNQQIKQLKEQSIDISLWRFLVYFGS